MTRLGLVGVVQGMRRHAPVLAIAFTLLGWLWPAPAGAAVATLVMGSGTAVPQLAPHVAADFQMTLSATGAFDNAVGTGACVLYAHESLPGIGVADLDCGSLKTVACRNMTWVRAAYEVNIAGECRVGGATYTRPASATLYLSPNQLPPATSYNAIGTLAISDWLSRT